MTSYRRIVLGLAVIGALVAAPVSADIEGTRRMERDNRRCARYGQHFDRDGRLTEREARKMERINCKRSGTTWGSSLFYAAEEP